MKIPRIAVLLEDERARDTWPKRRNFRILEPDMPVGDKVLMREVLERLHFNQNLFEPLVIIPNRHALTGIMT
jgi:hypothetical protein